MLGSRVLFPLARALGTLGPSAPRSELEHFFRAVGDMDPRAYWATLRGLLGAHASDVLPSVSVPVLIIAPAHDILAPARDLERLRTSIPGARSVLVPHTGHAILLEAGGVVAGHVGAFLRGLPPSNGSGLTQREGR